ncbi:hypothetical protein LCGC14_0308090 [marine sediment metagenome]|uniref:Uncharacterized protein n=1 Tax=marine sediment metagenome TaxID=412755 RepID=A0A0F9WUG5_9ZZZZ
MKNISSNQITLSENSSFCLESKSVKSFFANVNSLKKTFELICETTFSDLLIMFVLNVLQRLG